MDGFWDNWSGLERLRARTLGLLIPLCRLIRVAVALLGGSVKLSLYRGRVTQSLRPRVPKLATPVRAREQPFK